MNLSEHFTLGEFLDSQTAVRQGFDEQFTPPKGVVENLTALCDNVLEPISKKLSEKFGVHVSIYVSSGYRCERLNIAVGGSKTSDHPKGEASDITVRVMTVEEFYQFIKKSGIVFDQLIQEFGRWVHVSYNPFGQNRMQCLRAIKVDGKTKYIPEPLQNAA